MYQYYDEYVRNKGNTEAQTKWSNQLIWEIARHAVGEEIVIYPLMERHLGQEGVKLADHDRDDHQVRGRYVLRIRSAQRLI
jgi:iron-sulfur cluster repair protein YtfE (RIC family)